DARSPDHAAARHSGGRRGLLGPGIELPHRGVRPGVHLCRAARPRRRHEAERAAPADVRVTPTSPDGRPGVPGDMRSALARRPCTAVPAARSGAARRLPRLALRPLPAAVAPVASTRVKVLLVSLYFPPAGGGGVQRPLKLAQYLPALGIETHVLAPDDPKWVHCDAELRVPTQAWVPRARYVGPKARRPAEELHGTEGVARALVHARLAARRLLGADASVT